MGLDTVGVTAGAARGAGRRAPARRGAAVGHRRRHRDPAAHPRGQVPGRGRRLQHPGRAARGATTRPSRTWSTPTRKPPPSAPAEAPFSATVPLSEVARTATYTHAYAESNGFMTLLSDGERLTGAYALGPEAGEWLQQATLAIRARVPLDVLRDVIQPFPTFSGDLRGRAQGAARPAQVLRRQLLTVAVEAGVRLAVAPVESNEFAEQPVVEFFRCWVWLIAPCHLDPVRDLVECEVAERDRCQQAGSGRWRSPGRLPARWCGRARRRRSGTRRPNVLRRR